MAHKAAPTLPHLRMREELLKVLLDVATAVRKLAVLQLSLNFASKPSLQPVFDIVFAPRSLHQSSHDCLERMLMQSRLPFLKLTRLAPPTAVQDTVYKEVAHMLHLQTIQL